MTINKVPFAPRGHLALHPLAFGALVDCFDHASRATSADGVAVLDIRGPLMYSADWFFDSYEAIKMRLEAALSTKPRAVLMRIDSPGGLASGMIDTARHLRAACRRAGVPLHAYVGAQATSAAYGLASAADRIVVSASASIGSIGVITALVDATAQDRAQGYSVRLVTSGERKADGNPHAEISEAALASTQKNVDVLASMFFEVVVEHGWGKSVEAVRALQAATMTGLEAVSAGLASEVGTYEDALTFAGSEEARKVSQGATGKTTEAKGTKKMAEKYDAAIAELRKMAEGDDDDAEAAKKALAALDGDEEDGASAEGESEGESEGDDEDEPPKKDKPAASAAASKPSKASGSKRIALEALAAIHSLKAERDAEKLTAKREELLATRPDFDSKLVAALREESLATVEKMVKTLPRVPSRTERVDSSARATGTRGETQTGKGEGGARLSAEEKSELDQWMGLTSTKSVVEQTPHKISFGVRVTDAKKGE